MADLVLYGYRLRPQQAEILAYQRGRMAVSAVPGSGKTLTLALLAARLIVEGRIGQDSEVLVVTMQNSAVENISRRIRQVLTSRKLPPVGYRVCTLHKLANDIARQRLDLAGMEEGYEIVDEAESERIMQRAADVWIAAHRPWWQSFLPETTDRRRSALEGHWRQITVGVGQEVTKLCKHLRIRPPEAQQLVQADEGEGGFAWMGVDLYALHDRYLTARSGLDFDDLIWRGIDALGQDASFLLNLRARWPFILEDEAQDSSPLQEQILEKLAGEQGNWVRVGDPNQAIHSTFTAANPRYFRRFLRRDDVVSQKLAQSGRCGRPIIALANHLVHWACADHPEAVVRQTAFELQDISPTDPDDAQPNPPSDECHLYFREQPFADSQAEALQVATWAGKYVRREPERKVAILCPTQWQGAQLVEALQSASPPVPVDDLLRSTPQARNVAQVLAAACDYLGMPTSRRALAKLYGLLAAGGYLGPAPERGELRHQRTLVDSVAPHNLLFPREGVDLRERLPEGVSVGQEDAALIERFAERTSRWVRGIALPIDQLVLTVAQDLFEDEVDLAIAHTLASSLRVVGDMHPEMRLTHFAEELDEVARNRRSMANLSLADAGYEPKAGRVAVTTMHKAKGLEWDAVFLTSVDNLEFPDSCGDVFRDEPFFLPGRAPAIEARKRLQQIMRRRHAVSTEYLEGEAVRNEGGGGPDTTGDDSADEQSITEARLEYIAERLRLLYVGITRARRDLAFTWSETNGRRQVRMAAALRELSDRSRSEGWAAGLRPGDAS